MVRSSKVVFLLQIMAVIKFIAIIRRSAFIVGRVKVYADAEEEADGRDPAGVYIKDGQVISYILMRG